MKTIKELHITVALPASGKTTWAKEMVNDDHDLCHVDCDYWIKAVGRSNSVAEVITARKHSFREKIILDGLFLTKDSVKDGIRSFKDEGFEITKTVIHVWEHDVEKCLWNDQYRRVEDSTITIKNGVVDNFTDIKELRKDNKGMRFSVEMHEVTMKEPIEVFADMCGLYMDKDGTHKGDSWCTGGTWCSYTGDCGNVEPDAQPEGMFVLDKLLEKVAPNVTFLQYKNIMNECVYTDDSTEGDYYGGVTYHKQYVLNVKRLYNHLVEKELIEPIEPIV